MGPNRTTQRESHWCIQAGMRRERIMPQSLLERIELLLPERAIMKETLPLQVLVIMSVMYVVSLLSDGLSWKDTG